MKQTAVEWLVQVVQSCIAPDYIPKQIIEQAKATEKGQIKDAYSVGYSNGQVDSNRTAEQYYNKTFKSE